MRILCFLVLLCANSGAPQESTFEMEELNRIEEEVLDRLRLKIQKGVVLERLPTDLMPSTTADDESEDQTIKEDLELISLKREKLGIRRDTTTGLHRSIHLENNYFAQEEEDAERKPDQRGIIILDEGKPST